MAAWPGTLPDFFQVGGYTETGAENTIRTQMDVGPDKIRRRTVTDTRTVVGSMWLTPSQYTELKTFYEITHAYGSLPFTMDDAHGVNQTWRFLSPPVYTTLGPENWQVRLNIEEMP